MPRYEIAHIQEQGVDIIVIPLDAAFGTKSLEAQYKTIDELQERAKSAGLKGTVVPVWKSEGQLRYIAPPNWHDFFNSIDFQYVASHMNKYISW
jgi:hypothetical protein